MNTTSKRIFRRQKVNVVLTSSKIRRDKLTTYQNRMNRMEVEKWVEFILIEERKLELRKKTQDTVKCGTIL